MGMALDVMATLAAGFGLAGLALALRWLTGRRLGRWAVPAAAAAGMLLYQVWSEYTWYARTRAILPAGHAVLVAVEERAFWRPWSLVVPQVTRFAAVDAAGQRRNPAHPGLRIADVHLLERRAPRRTVPHVVDCPGRRAAPLAEGAGFTPDGIPEGVAWADLAADDPLLAAVCTD